MIPQEAGREGVSAEVGPWTPGPWFWSGLCLMASRGDHSEHITKTEDGCWELEDADKALIAATPEMFEALVGVMPILARAESNASGNPEWDNVGPRVSAARAALNKALGK